MAIWSTYLADALLDHILRGVAMPSFGASVYVSLHTGDPGQDGANEVSGGSYARVAVTRGTGTWEETSDSTTTTLTKNDAGITYPAPTGTWGTVSHAGFWDAASAGNFLFGGQLDTARSPVNGDNAPSFAVDALVVKL